LSMPEWHFDVIHPACCAKEVLENPEMRNIKMNVVIKTNRKILQDLFIMPPI
jgi:hypothetical protein